MYAERRVGGVWVGLDSLWWMVWLRVWRVRRFVRVDKRDCILCVECVS